MSRPVKRPSNDSVSPRVKGGRGPSCISPGLVSVDATSHWFNHLHWRDKRNGVLMLGFSALVPL